MYKQINDVYLNCYWVHSNTWNYLTLWKKSSCSFENIINKMCLHILYIKYMCIKRIGHQITNNGWYAINDTHTLTYQYCSSVDFYTWKHDCWPINQISYWSATFGHNILSRKAVQGNNWYGRMVCVCVCEREREREGERGGGERGERERERKGLEELVLFAMMVCKWTLLNWW